MSEIPAMKRLHILHSNDLHSQLEQTPKIYTVVSSLRQKWEQQGEKSLLLDIGDHMDRVRLETEGTDGQMNRAILEATGYDAITFGNNELLTFSQQHLEEIYQDSSVSVISTNVTDVKSGERPSWMLPRKIITCDGIRVGLLGVTIPYPLVYEMMGWQVKDPEQILKEEVEQYREEVDVLVLLSHLGLFHDQQIAEKVQGIDIILGGHTHHLLETPEWIGTTLIAAAGKFGSHLGQITIEFDLKKRKIIHMEGCCHPLDDVVGPAAQIVQLMEQYRLQAEKNLSFPVAHLQQPLPISWQRESPFGNLLADSLREWVGAEMAMVNSGQLLADLPAGEITRGKIHQVCPHPINPVLIEIEGKRIWQSLEESLLEEYIEMGIRGFGFRGKILGSLCVSGLHIVYDPNGVPYHKIRSIRIGAKPLYKEKTYQLATVDMFTFGAGYLELKKGKLLRYYLPEFLRDLIAYQLKKPHAVRVSQTERWHTLQEVTSSYPKRE